jgi:hypothetical protein
VEQGGKLGSASLSFQPYETGRTSCVVRSPVPVMAQASGGVKSRMVKCAKCNRIARPGKQCPDCGGEMKVVRPRGKTRSTSKRGTGNRR